MRKSRFPETHTVNYSCLSQPDTAACFRRASAVQPLLTRFAASLNTSATAERARSA